jgi:hypothetical protein
MALTHDLSAWRTPMSICSLEPTSIVYYSGYTLYKKQYSHTLSHQQECNNPPIYRKLSLDARTGDHTTTREDRSASRQVYCFAVMRGRDLLLSLEDNGALVF